MPSPLKAIQTALVAHAELNQAAFFEKAVPGKQKIYGVKTPRLNELARKYQAYGFDLVKALWKAGSLEEKIIAIKITEKTGRKEPEQVLKLFQRFAKTIDNWAVCDGLGMQFLRGITRTHSTQIFRMASLLNRSADPWQRRLSLVMVEWYTRDKKFHPQILRLVKNLQQDEEYYVKKAVAWINRNFKKGK